MSVERRDAEPLQPPAMPEIFDETPASDQETLRRDVQRAADRAVMAIFELAFSLESLSNAIGRFRAETRSPFESDGSLAPPAGKGPN